MPAFYTAADVRRALKTRYAPPEWAIFNEVANGTGSLARRSADALAMNLFPSRGLRMHGFEIKVSRSDWLHELKQPDKSDPVQRYCDHWWIVSPADIVKEGELPPTWGHLILKGNGLNCVVKAPDLERQPWTPAFLAALLRRAHESMERGIREGVNEALASERAAVEAEIRKRVNAELEQRRSENNAAIKSLAQVQEACGLPIDRWLDSDGFGKAIGLVHRLGVAKTYSNIERAVSAASRFAAEAAQVLPAMIESTPE
jgi:hypothetical protein